MDCKPGYDPSGELTRVKVGNLRDPRGRGI